MSADLIASLVAASVADTLVSLSMDATARAAFTDVTVVKSMNTDKCIVYAKTFWKTYEEMQTAQSDYFSQLAEGIDSVTAVAITARNAAEIAHQYARDAELKMVNSCADIEAETISVAHEKHAAASDAFRVACKSYSVLKDAINSSDDGKPDDIAVEAHTLMQRLFTSRGTTEKATWRSGRVVLC
jgi:hypothetical protein